MNLNDPRLAEITDAANARLEEVHQLFGWNKPFRRIEPGYVAVILEVAGHDTPPAEPVPAPPAPEPPAPAASKDAGDDAKPDPVSARPSNVAMLERAKTAIRAMAQDGQMPTMAEFNKRRPAGMPTANHITQRTFVRWGELAAQLGLTMNKGRRKQAKPSAKSSEHRPAPAKEPPPAHRTPSPRQPAPRPAIVPGAELSTYTDADKRRRLLEDIIFALRDMAVDGHLPSAEEWDAHRPAELPDHSTIVLRWGFDNWDDLAGYAKLTSRTAKRSPVIKQEYLEIDE